MENLEKALL